MEHVSSLFEDIVGLFFGFVVDFGGEIFVEGPQGDHEGGEVIGKTECRNEIGHHIDRKDEISQSADDEGFGLHGHILCLQEEIELQGRVEHFGSHVGSQMFQFLPEGVLVVVTIVLRCGVDTESLQGLL